MPICAESNVLGVFSTQASESVHYDFIQTWNNFKVASTHEKYGQKLKEAVVNYDSYHIADFLTLEVVPCFQLKSSIASLYF